MQFIYAPPAHFSFVIALKILPTPIVETLTFQISHHNLPLVSEQFPFLHQQLDDYFLKKSVSLDMPHKLIAKSDFQRRVLTALKEIPLGSTLTYGDFAKTLNTHPRAIGQALKSNPLPLIYPCHRIVSKTALGGFMGQAKGEHCDIKQQLLELEQT